MYPLDRRRVAVNVYECIQSLRKSAVLLGVSHSTIARWLQSPEPKGYDKTHRMMVSKSARVIQAIRLSIANDPLQSCKQIAARLLGSLNVKVSRELVRTALKSAGMSRKKARFFGSPPDLQAKTDDFIRLRDQYVHQGREFWSLDETSFGRHGAPVYGFNPKGRPLHIRKRAPRVTTVSALAAAHTSGHVYWEQRVGSYNTASFVEFLRTVPASPGAVILLDNVAFHRSRAAREVARDRGLDLLFVPPYSPWFNPIEGVFSIVKRAWYRGDVSIDQAFAKVTPAHTSAFFQKSMHCKGLEGT